MRTVLYIIAGPLFLISVTGYVYVKVRLRPKDCDLDDVYWEFEDRHPGYAVYLKWSRITFAAVVIAMLLLLAAVAI